MYRGRARKTGGRGGSNFSRGRSAARGLFKDNIWYCDCEPQRLPAEHFKVKKEGKNKGRWFYTCQQEESKRCGFFLWDEDAEPRMQSAVLNGPGAADTNSRASDQVGWSAGRGVGTEEPVQGRGLFVGSNRQRGRDASTESEDSPPPSYTSALHSSSGGQKRRAIEAQLDDNEEFYDWDPTQLNDSDLIHAADNAPKTPHKAQKTGVYATPATSVRRKLPWMEGEEEAESSRTNGKKNVTFLDTPSKESNYVARNDEPVTPVAPTTGSIGAKSPLPQSRYKDALSNPGDSQATLTNEALAALSGVTIPPDILSKLRGILTKHDLRTQGVVKGRDISRLALKAKEAKIAELQAKIASLEAEQELQRHLRAVYGKSAEDEALSTQDAQTLQ